jgi:hypothetical protein
MSGHYEGGCAGGAGTSKSAVHNPETYNGPGYLVLPPSPVLRFPSYLALGAFDVKRNERQRSLSSLNLMLLEPVPAT